MDTWTVVSKKEKEKSVEKIKYEASMYVRVNSRYEANVVIKQMYNVKHEIKLQIKNLYTNSMLSSVKDITDVQIKYIQSTTLEDSNYEGMSWVSFDNDEIIGQITFNRNDPDNNIKNFAVHGLYQKHGLGSKLLSLLIMYVRGTKCKKLTAVISESNINARSFFEYYGFTIEGYGNDEYLKYIGMRKIYYYKYL